MSRNRRRQIALSDLALLRQTYDGKRCVVSGGDTNVDWHHLNEDPRDSVFANLVPVEAEFNRTLEMYRRSGVTSPAYMIRDERLTPAYLLHISGHWFRTGRPGLAYGAARLATWLVLQYRPLFPESDLPVSSVCQSLSCARHAARTVLIDVVVERELQYILASRSLTREHKIALVVEVASAFQDWLYLDAARELLDWADAASKGSAPGVASVRAKALRRLALDRVVRETDLSTAAKALEEAGEGRHDSSVALGQENALTWLLRARGRQSDAANVNERLLELEFATDGLPRSVAVAPWNAIETLLTAAALRNGSRQAATLSRLERLGGAPSLRLVRLRPVAVRLSLGTAPASHRLTELATALSDTDRPSIRTVRSLEEVSRQLLA